MKPIRRRVVTRKHPPEECRKVLGISAVYARETNVEFGLTISVNTPM
jgi:hypothetical protein